MFFTVNTSKSISRVLFLIAIYLRLLLPIAFSDLPTGWRRTAAFSSPYLVLLQMGFTEPVSRLTAGELLPHLSILTQQSWAVYFCCTILRVAPTGCYPASCPLELGLSSCISMRPSDLLVFIFFSVK